MDLTACDLVRDKATYGAFCRSDLEQRLLDHDLTKLAICGVTADVCVHTTLREATDRGFDCYYVRDAISTFSPEVREVCERMVTEEGGIWNGLQTASAVRKKWKAEKQTFHGSRVRF